MFDSMNSIKTHFGENNHEEYEWITDETNQNPSISNLKEELIQIFYQCVRTDFVSRYNVAMKFKNWISNIFLQIYANKAKQDVCDEQTPVNLAIYGYKMIAQLRDIYEGKGECRFAYDMLYAYYEGISSIYNKIDIIYREEIITFNEYTSSMMALEFMQSSNNNNNQYGSYKDYKYLCHEFILLLLADELNPEEVNNRYIEQIIGKNKRSGLITFRFTPEMIEYLSSHPIINTISKHYGKQIYNDYLTINTSNTSNTSNKKQQISLSGKWAPRASSKLFAPLRKLLFPYVIPEYRTWTNSANNQSSKQKSELKIETNYRKRLSIINKALNTVQIKQCENKWSEIDFDKHITSITLHRQKKAFMKPFSNATNSNTNPENSSQVEKDRDREICSNNFALYLESIKNNKSIAKNKCISVTDYVKQAKKLLIENKNILSKTITPQSPQSPQSSRTSPTEILKQLESEKALLDKQWETKGLTINNLDNFIAMVDTSGSMDSDNSYPLNTAIGLGLRIAEKSLLGNRIMTFSETPTWINLKNTPSFTERVDKVLKCNWGYNTNFYAAMNLILIAIINSKLQARDVSKLTLVVLSDMQMDSSDENLTSNSNSYSNSNSNSNSKDVLFQKIKQNYANAGIQQTGEPYKVPNIIFWNLRKTDGFPCISTDERAVMVSGGSDILLNDICNKGVKALEKINSWNVITNVLDKKRYAKLEKYFTF